jgi:putative transcriptional regulator|tara:strand:- start:72 stop:632 length:561 start_codon:yes stop_codon:yes gene_type:complete
LSVGLENNLLIAMPSVKDPNFDGTVTYVCKHDEKGAMGIIINRPLKMRVSEIFNQLSFETIDNKHAEQLVLGGGPIQQEMGFVLHQSNENYDKTLNPSDLGIKVTISQDILSSMAQGKGPQTSLVALGYAGWDPGQLEAELTDNTWLSVPANPVILFDTPFDKRREAAAALLGIKISQLSAYAGHA